MKFICVKKIIWETSVEVAECLCLCNRCEAMPQQYLEGRTRRLFAKTTTILGCHSFFSSVFLFLLSSKEKRPFVVLNFKDGSEGVSYKHACTLFTIANRKTGHQNKRRLIVVEMFLNPWQRKALTEWENRFADTRLLVGLPFLAPASTCILSLAETLFKMYNLPRTSICCNPPKKNKTKQDKTLPGDLLSLGSNTPLSK